MIGGLIKGLISFFSGGVANKITTAAIDFTALAAILAPVVLWFLGHKDEVAITLTWSQVLFFGLILAAVIKVAHYTRAGRPDDRSDFR